MVVGKVGRVGRGVLSLIMNLIVDWYDDRTVMFASGLRPDWKSGGNTIKDHPKKSSHVQFWPVDLKIQMQKMLNHSLQPSLVHITSQKKRWPKVLKMPSTISHAEMMWVFLHDLLVTWLLISDSDGIKLVSITTDEEEEYAPHPTEKKAAARIPRPKSEKNNKGSTSVMTAVTVKEKNKAKRLNNNNIWVTDLPEFAQKKWWDTFLPTLYDKFFASEEPFSGFYKGSNEFVTLLQSIIKEVYPDVDYEVNSSDSIHFLVCQVPCLNESTFIFFYYPGI